MISLPPAKKKAIPTKDVSPPSALICIPRNVSFIRAGTELMNTNAKNRSISLLRNTCFNPFIVTGFGEACTSGINQTIPNERSPKRTNKIDRLLTPK